MQQERIHFAGERRTGRWSPARIFTTGVLVVFLIPVIIMNATPGHFGYPDTDGCACFVTYTTRQSNPACTTSRLQQCDFRFDQLLVFLSGLDFNP